MNINLYDEGPGEQVALDLIKEYVRLTNIRHNMAFLRNKYFQYHGVYPNIFQLGHIQTAFDHKLRELELEIQRIGQYDRLIDVMGWRRRG